MLNPIFWKKVQGQKHPGDGQMDSRLLNSLLNAEPRYIAEKLIPTMALELKKNDAADQIYTAYADDMIGVTPEAFQQELRRWRVKWQNGNETPTDIQGTLN